MLHGVAGTGKTFISCYLAFDDMVKKISTKGLLLSEVQFLLGILAFCQAMKKRKHQYMKSHTKIFVLSCFRGVMLMKILKTKGLVHFMTTSFIRGVTLRNATIMIDECQNMTFHELDSIITRIGQGCRVIFCGDFRHRSTKKRTKRFCKNTKSNGRI